MLKCVSILKVKLLTMVLYFCKKCILQRVLLMIGGTTLKERYFFLHGTTSSCSVMIGYLGNKKFSVNKICKYNNGRVVMIETEIFTLLNLYNLNSETEEYDLIDIWRVKNPWSTRFPFRKKHFSGFIQRSLDYILISNSVQESVQNIDVLPSFCSDHSLLLLSYKKLPHSNLEKNFWKFNCSLIHD